jgi:hypothetical protein
VPGGYAAKFPERFLNSLTERFERLRKTQRHTFHIAVRQHAVEKRVIESMAGNLHPQFIAHREVTGRQASGVMVLVEEDRLPRPMQAAPLTHAALKRASRGVRKLTRMCLLQPFEQRLRFKPRFHFEPLLDVVPDIGKRVGSCAISSNHFLLRRQTIVVAILACCLLTHYRHPCRIGQSPAHTEQSPKFLDTPIRDHRNLHENQELQ